MNLVFYENFEMEGSLLQIVKMKYLCKEEEEKKEEEANNFWEIRKQCTLFMRWLNISR